MKTEDIDRLIGMPDVDKEWAKFEAEVIERPRSRYRRIAAIIIAVFSLGIVAASVLVVSEFYNPMEVVKDLKDSRDFNDLNNPKVLKAETSVAQTDTLPSQPPVLSRTMTEPLTFDNVELQDIAAAIAERYNVKSEFKNDKAKHVRLYLQIDGEKSLPEVVQMLNNFQKIHLTLNGETLIIE